MVSFTTLTSTAAVGILSLIPAVRAGEDWVIGLPRENCDIPDYAHIVGDGSTEEGYAFCASRFKEGVLIKSLEVQGDYNAIRGMVVTFTDNSYEQFGQMEFEDVDYSRRNKVEFDPTVDTITKIQLWPNGWNDNDNRAVGKFVLDASNGGKIDLSHDWADEIQPSILDIGNSGMLLGVAGRGDHAIDRLDFIFAKEPIKTRSIEDMFLTPPIEEINLRQSNEDRGFVVEYLDEVHHVNKLDSPTEIWLRGEKRVSESTAITKTSTDTFHLGMGFEFKASMGIPLIAEGELTTKTDMFWEHTETRTNTETTTEEITKAWQQIATAEPNSAIRCYAWTFEATTTDISWEGTIRIVFEDDTVLEYPSEGAYNTAQYSRVNTYCEEETVEEADAALRQGMKVYEDGELVGRRQIGAHSKAKAARHNG